LHKRSEPLSRTGKGSARFSANRRIQRGKENACPPLAEKFSPACRQAGVVEVFPPKADPPQEEKPQGFKEDTPKAETT